MWQVSGSTHANAAYWETKCQGIPARAEYLLLEMGTVGQTPLRVCVLRLTRRAGEGLLQADPWRDDVFHADV